MSFLPHQLEQLGAFSFALVIALGITLYAAGQALIFAHARYRRSLHLYFFAMSVVVTLLFLVDSRYYAAESVAEAAPLLQWRVALVLAFYPALFGFVAIYTGQLRYGRWLLLLTSCIAALIAINFTLTPYSLRFASLEAIPQQKMLWGELLWIYSGKMSGWNIVARVVTLSVLLWGIARAYILFRRGAQRTSLFLCLALCAILFSSALSFSTDLGQLNFVYLGGFAFLALILLMSLLLGLDLHDMNRALISTSEDLKHRITLQEKAEEHIRQLGFRDNLTELPNRAKLEELLTSLLSRHTDAGKRGALIMLGLDDFKTINDVLGHDIGDQVLQLVAQRLRGLHIQDGVITRFSGDEFIILFPDLSTDERPANIAAYDLAKRCLGVFSQPFEFDGHTLEIGACAGILVFSYPSRNEKKPLRCVETALYRAKSLGRGSIQLYESAMQAELTDRLLLERDMRKGMHRGDFHVYYQPQIDLVGNVVGAEALLRWRHPERGFISPAIFIPIAERSGLIHQLGDWVLRQACEQIVSWKVSAPSFKGHVSVNVSSWQISQRDYEKRVQQCLSASGADATRLTLEITESAFIHDLDEAITRINALRSLGLRFSIDDFGTGYSSLSYLRRLPVDELKIDQSFVKNLGADARDTHMIETIINIAKCMGMKVVAEGVENEAQRTALIHMDCWALQGYHLGPPMDRWALQGYHLAPPMDKDRFLAWFNDQHERKTLSDA